MTGEHGRHVIRLLHRFPLIKLACTTCQLIYEPDLADFSTGNTGCPQCRGWTWIAQLDSTEWPVTPPRTPARLVPNYVEVIEECRSDGGRR